MFGRMKVLKHRLMQKDTFRRWTILNGDFVQVVAGKEKGKQGFVRSVIRNRNQVVVEGVNLKKHHISGTESNVGRIVLQEGSVHVSNVQLIDPVKGVPTKVSRRFAADGRRIRVSRLTGAEIPKPQVEKKARAPFDAETDTKWDVAAEPTFNPEDVRSRRDIAMAMKDE